jgi:hypothetical protein
VCTGWLGALGQIDDAAEQACVDAHVAGAAWIGLLQPETAATPEAGWTWNAVNPLAYTHWQPGVPDDDDGVESRQEQCAKLQSDGLWDDVTCGSQVAFLCERP